MSFAGLSCSFYHIQPSRHLVGKPPQQSSPGRSLQMWKLLCFTVLHCIVLTKSYKLILLCVSAVNKLILVILIKAYTKVPNIEEKHWEPMICIECGWQAHPTLSYFCCCLLILALSKKSPTHIDVISPATAFLKFSFCG